MALRVVQEKKYVGVTLVGRRAVVVGGTAGIGRGVALRLAKANVSVTVVGRNRQAGDEVAAQMRAAATSDVASFDYVACDASLLANIAQFAQTYAARADVDKLDYLVLAQGEGVLGHVLTAEGLDLMMVLHYYGRMLFVDRLLPLLRRSPDARVLSIFRGGKQDAYKEYATDPGVESFSVAKVFAAPGFYNDLALDSFSRDNPGITFMHIYPGAVRTNYGHGFPFWIRIPLRILVRFVGKSIDDCGELMCDALFKSEYGHAGFLDVDENANRAEQSALHEAARETVWRHTRQVFLLSNDHSAVPP